MFILVTAVLFPLICGLIVPLLKNMQNRKFKLSLVLAMQAVETVFCALIIFSETMRTGVFKITKLITLGFSSDGLSKLFVAIVCIGWLLVLLYACVYMKHEKNEERFFSFMLLSEGAMIGAALSSGLVSMYIFYELVTLFSMPLVLHSLSAESVAAAKKYLYYSVAGELKRKLIQRGRRVNIERNALVGIYKRVHIVYYRKTERRKKNR